MVKTYFLENLECGHCAEKIETEVGKMKGVSKSSCALLTQKLTVDVDDRYADSLISDIKNIVKKVDSDVTVLEK